MFIEIEKDVFIPISSIHQIQKDKESYIVSFFNIDKVINYSNPLSIQIDNLLRKPLHYGKTNH